MVMLALAITPNNYFQKKSTETVLYIFTVQVQPKTEGQNFFILLSFFHMKNEKLENV